MKQHRLLVAVAGSVLLGSAAPAFAQADGADGVREKIAALTAPQFDASRRADREYVNEYRRERQAHLDARAELALALYRLEPESADAQALMTERWTTLGRAGTETAMLVLGETEEASRGDSAFATTAAYTHAQTLGGMHRWDPAKSSGAVEAFIARAPADERCARLLYSLAGGASDSEAQIEIYRRMLAEYPDARSTKYVHGKIRQAEGVGQPFELAFQDAVTGETVDLLAAKGTIYVIDFWATWCGPCIAEMPHMKELYSEFREQGVQFIGVSLDQAEDKGGLTKLLEYVETNEIEWPQYYQGAYWDGEFSRSWGINSIPSLFVVDHEGNLHSTSARGKLEKMIPELIAKRADQN